MKKKITIFVFALAEAISLVFFPFATSAAQVYSLTSPIPSEVNFPHVIQGRQSYASQHIMWEDPQGNINMINSFGGADVAGNENAYFHYINAGTGAHALVEGGKCSFGRNSVFDPVHNKFYWFGEYCSNAYGGSLNEFDPVTMTNTVIKDGGTDWYGGQMIALGKNNKIYFMAINTDYYMGGGSHLFEYDPEVGPSSWTDYGVVYGPSNGIAPGIVADTSHIYVAWQQNTSPNYWHLMVHPIGSGSWSEIDFGDGLYPTGYNLWFDMEDSTQKFYVGRSVDGGSTWKYYYLESGGVNYVGTSRPPDGGQAKQDVNMKGHISMMSYGNYNEFLQAYDFDMNWDYDMPTPSNSTSTVYYGSHSTWNYPISDFSTSTLDYTGPWYDLATKEAVPKAGSTDFYAIGESVNDYNYQNQSGIPVYMRNLPSIYHAMGVPASYSPLNTQEAYFSGYPGQFWRWNPAQPWSDTNPRVITLNQGANYRLFMDYDANGKIWIGSNVCGATPGCVDYGTVAWYDPATEEKGEMFQGVWTGGNPPATGNGIKYTNLAMSNDRTKLVVSSNDGLLTVINALTETIEGTYNLGKKAFMVEVSNDKVLGITKDGDPSLAFLFQPSTRTMLIPPQSIGVSGQTFGNGDGSISRRQFKLERGPDGYAWLFVDNKVYRVNPTTLAFEYIATDNTDSNKLIFADNKKDLLLYGGTHPSYFPDLLTITGDYEAADINEDDLVNPTDFNILKSDFLKLAANLTNPRSDVDGDGQATIKDVGIMMSEWAP